LNLPQISPRELASKLTGPEESRPYLLDVRTPAEHRIASLPGAALIPLQELQRRAAELEELRGRKVVVFCHHGGRSLSATNFLIQLGFDASSLAGGIDGWSATVDPSVPRY
jgi:rhodanese-related sulfurtransferase